MTLSSSMEDYLEAVLVLRKQSGYARCVDVAAYLQVTKPSVSRAVKELIKGKIFMQRFKRYTRLDFPRRTGCYSSI